MTRNAFAQAIGTDSAWISNTSRILKLRIPRTEAAARLYALIRILQQEFDFALPAAARAAKSALSRPPDAVVVVRESVDGCGTLTINMARFHSMFSLKLSAALSYYVPQQRGRPRTRVRDAVEAAAAYGEDISLILSNLRRTPAERLARLDENAAFVRELRRNAR